MRVAILEDDLSNASSLIDHLDRFSKENDIVIDHTHFENGMDFLNPYRACFDVIFLDIEMPLINGIETAKQIRKYDPDVLIIFITYMAQYAIEGYSVQALDYILKPVGYYPFSMKMKQVVNIISSRQSESLIISNQSGKVRIPLNHLKYIEVKDHTLYYYTTDECFHSTSHPSLAKLAQKLAPHGFVRCHQGYLVNLQFVQKFEKNSVQIGNDLLPMSRTYYKNFTQSLLNYWGEHI